MKRLELIPIPRSRRWREFRMRVLPVIVFVTLCAVAGVMWRNYARQGMMLGLGEGVRSVVASPQPAMIEQWLVKPYTIVQQGTPLARLRPVDPRGDFDYLRSLFELERARVQPSVAEENAMNFERIRVELLQTRSEVAIARVKLELAERDVARNAPLYREKLVSEDIYELSVNTRDALKAEVVEKSRAMAEIESRLEHLRPIGEPGMMSVDDAGSNWLARVEKAQAAALANLQPLTLLAPITGMVGLPQRRAGEFVTEGEWLLTINSLRADRIVGYLRQPYPIDPKPGMEVRVTTKTQKSQTFSSHIVQIGAHVEAITNAIGFIPQGTFIDAGLPVIVHVPDDIQIRPGEVVGLTIRPKRIGSMASPTVEPGPDTTRSVPGSTSKATVDRASIFPEPNTPVRNFVICRGACDASAIVPVGDDHFLVADDEDNILRVYSRTAGGLALHTLDFSGFLGVGARSMESDLEGAAPLGDRVYWISSHARNKDGEERPSRRRFFATTVSLTNGNISIQPVGRPYANLLSDLLSEPRLERFNLAHASSLAPKAKGALNIEGLCATPEGHLLIGFRNPIPGGRALVVPLLNPSELIEGKTARFGDPVLLDLAGLGIRSIARAEDRYFIAAGSYDGSGRSFLYEWRDGGESPRRLPNAEIDGLNPEGIECLTQDGATRLLVVSDDGTLKIGGIECKEVKDPNLRYFRATTIGL